MRDIPTRPSFLSFEKRAFGADDIAFLLTKPSIRGLTFTDCTIADEAVRALCALPKLERLWLAGTAVTDAVMPDIARVPLLNWLVLDNTAIGDPGVAALAGHRKLQHLSLRQTRVSDACVQHLVGLACLAYLDVKGSALTRAGLLALAAHPTVRLRVDDTRPAELDDQFAREQRRLASRTPPGLVAAPGEEQAMLAALRGFWDGISAWETKLAQESAAGRDLGDWCLAERAAVFERFCTPRHATSGRAQAGSFGNPPTYAQLAIVDVEWLSARKVCVYATDSVRAQRRFVLMKQGSSWLVDHMQNLFEGWKTGYL